MRHMGKIWKESETFFNSYCREKVAFIKLLFSCVSYRFNYTNLLTNSAFRSNVDSVLKEEGRGSYGRVNEKFAGGA